MFNTEKKAFWIIFTITLILFLSAFFFSYKKSAISPSNSTRVESVSFTDQSADSSYEIDVQYPHLSGFSDAYIQDTVNKNIKNSMELIISDFKNRDAEMTHYKEAPKSTFFARYEVSLLSKNIFSFRENISEYSSGSAHPNSYTQTFGYNLDSGKSISLQSLFSQNSDYLQKISHICISSLLSNLGEDDKQFMEEWIKNGAGAKEENFQNFLFSESGIVFIFDPYQVGPYAMGSQEVTIPYSELRDIGVVEGVISRLIN